MKWISIVCVASLILFSCKKQEEQKEENKGFTFGSSLQTNRLLNSTELGDLKAACSLLRDKREYFERLEDNVWQFEFKGEEKTCQRAQPNTRFITRLRVPDRGPTTFDSKTRRYISSVLTDKDGFLSHYCEPALNGDPVFLIQNVGGKKLQMKLKRSGDFYFSEASWYHPNARGEYRSYLIEKVLIHTTKTTRNSRYYGVIKSRAQHRPCDGGGSKFLAQSLL